MFEFFNVNVCLYGTVWKTDACSDFAPEKKFIFWVRVIFLVAVCCGLI